MKKCLRVIAVTMVALIMATSAAYANDTNFYSIMPPGGELETFDCVSDEDFKNVVHYDMAEAMYDDGYIMVWYACDLSQEEGSHVDVSDPQAIRDSYFSLNRKTRTRLVCAQESNREPFEDPNDSIVTAEDGSLYLKFVYENEDVIIYTQPVTTNFFRVIWTVDNGSSMEKYALSYEDTKEKREQVYQSLLQSEQSKEVTSPGVYAGVFLVIAVIFGAAFAAYMILINRRYSRIERKKNMHPEKYQVKKPDPDDILITLNCRVCRKDYQIYVDPQDEAYIRKTRERCPECAEKQRQIMSDIAERNWFR